MFDELANASREAAAAGAARTLKVSVEPAIASRWLVGRLGAFGQLHPDIELSIDPATRLIDFHAEDFDLGIRYGLGNWDDVDKAKLSDVVIFPVCAPLLFDQTVPMRPAGLSRHTLLHENRKQWWADWLSEAGIDSKMDWRGTVFQSHLAIEAAEAGQGFALGDQILCTDALAAGRLVRPFAFDMKDHGSYWVVRKKGSRETAPERAFREWLMGEMVETNRRFQSIKAKDPKPLPKPAG